MKRIMTIYMVLLATGLCACSDWLAVRPKTEVASDELFQTEDGFKSALIGIYGRMTLDELYGQQLSYLFLEQLVQRYDGRENLSDQERARIYDYKNTTDSKNRLASIWENMYRNISNINNLLTQLEINGDNVVTPGYREMIKGEALGLRAFHYFDLLRMWGPIYQSDSTGNAVPWRTEFTPDKAPLMQANDLVVKILDDLSQASVLLQNDEMHYLDKGDAPFEGNRSQRMNKMAVKALQARVLLYRGDKAAAARCAQEVIDQCGLNLVKNNRSDVSMSEETIFGLNIYKMEDRVRNYFTTSFGQGGSELWVLGEHIDAVYERTTVGINDIRYRNGYGFLHENNKSMCRKYLPSSTVRYNGKVPLIRLAEMYYIIAECRPQEDGVAKFNAVRNARGISRQFNLQYTSAAEWVNVLDKEYQKDFFAEGQYFYFLKRQARESFYRCPLSGMTVAEYVFPYPDGEVEFGSAEN